MNSVRNYSIAISLQNGQEYISCEYHQDEITFEGPLFIRHCKKERVQNIEYE